MADVLLLELGLPLLILDAEDAPGDLVRVHRVVLPIQLPLLLLLGHLRAQSRVRVQFVLRVKLSAPLDLAVVPGVPLGHLAEHDLLVTLRRLVQVTTLRLKVLQSLDFASFRC